jgi:LPS export ABC transporter protein LptC
MAFCFIAITFLISACQPIENKQPIEYKGPLRIVEKAELYYTESELVKVKMFADLLYEFQNGDREFPKGLYMEFYDDNGKLESTLKANHAFYFKTENKWRGQGKVEVKNIEKEEQLNTEELFWSPEKKKIFTDKFVTIHSEGDVLYGEGLDAKQDMSDYTILKPTGEIYIKEEQQ